MVKVQVCAYSKIGLSTIPLSVDDGPSSDDSASYISDRRCHKDKHVSAHTVVPRRIMLF